MHISLKFKVLSFLRRNKGIFILLGGVAIFRTAIADWNPVPSSSMEPTLYPGDVVLVSRLAYGASIPFTDFRLFEIGQPERGDIVTFYPPHTDKLLVKRVIGIPGDRIDIHGTRISVNGALLSQEFFEEEPDKREGVEVIDGHSHSIQYTQGIPLNLKDLSLTVPEGKYFAMGDNRNNSVDSRIWGFFDQDKITGKVTHIGVSFSSKRTLNERVALPIDTRKRG
ncbi:MAG: signal peptidase I [Flavobacteriales bacterium]|jgi:signal peptidase I